jgi:hypothetical protein
MKPFLKYGLIVGVVSFVVILPVSILFGICGPFVSVIGGAVAGYLTAHFGKFSVKQTGAKQGALAGLVTGGFTLIGQIVSGLVALFMAQSTAMESIMGSIPNTTDPAVTQTVYYFSGIIAGGCFGLIGLGLAAGFGALLGYFGTKVVENTVIVDGQ